MPFVGVGLFGFLDLEEGDGAVEGKESESVERDPGTGATVCDGPDYVALRRRWKEGLAWQEHSATRIGISSSWPLPWQWDGSCHPLPPVAAEQVHMVRAVLGMTREDGLRERDDALYELEGADLEPWLLPVEDPGGGADPLFSLTIHLGMDGMGSAIQSWAALPFDGSHALIVTRSAAFSPLPMPLGLVSLDAPVAGAALLARDHPAWEAGCVGFESLDMFEVGGLDLRQAYRLVLGICGAVDDVVLSEDPEAAAAEGGHPLPGGLSLFASRLPGPDGRRRISRTRGGRPRPGELGPVAELVGRWTIGYLDEDGLVCDPAAAWLELREDGSYRWDPPPRWARREGAWGVVRRGEGIHGIFVETRDGTPIEHYLVLTRIPDDAPPRMHWQLTRWDAVVFADRVLVADRSDGPRLVG